MNRLAAALLLGCQYAMLWEATEQHTVPVIMAAATVLWLLTPYSWRASPRWVGILSAAMIVSALVLQRVVPVQLTPGQNYVHLLIATCGMGVQMAHLLGRRLNAVSSVAFAMGTIYSLSVLDFQSYSSLTVGWALLAPAFAVVSLQIVSLTAIIVGGALTSTAISSQMPMVRRWVAAQLNISTRRVVQREVGFSTGGWIGAVAKSKKTDPLALVLTVTSDQAPGYLKARAYDTFTGKRWLPVRPAKRVDATRPREDAPVADRRLFPLKQATGPWRKVTVENSEELRGIFFVPPETAYFAGGGDRLALGRNGDILRAAPSLRYTAFVGQTATVEPPTDSRLTEVPPSIDPRVGQMARRIAGQARSDAQVITAIASHLRNRFEYSLDGFEIPEFEDATSHFLLNRKPAHCEFFATGTVAMLRHMGIPCRYVIGFLTTEMEDDVTWKARNQDAHAWVEAYDRDQKRWVTVDSTPGSGLDDDQASAITNGTGNAMDINAIEEISSWWALVVMVVRQPLFLAGALGVFAMLLPRLSRLTRGRLDQLTKQTVWLDRRLRRRGFKRLRHETRHQFATRINDGAGEDTWLHKAAQWQREYANVRFGDRPPEALSDPRGWST